MQENVRPSSTSPPPTEDVAIENVKHYNKWMACHTYFLDRSYTLPGVTPFNMFIFEFTDEQWQQVYNEKGEKVQDVYNLNVRFWKKTKDVLYYIRRVTVKGNEINVTFCRIWMDRKKRDEFTTFFVLANEFMGLTNPFFQDNMPRTHAINLFQRYTDRSGKPMPISHIVKFFNALQYILIAQSCKIDKNAVNNCNLMDTRLQRMTNIMLSTWDNYPGFAERFHKTPTPIEDQQFSQIADPLDSFGNMVVLLEMKPMAHDYLPFIKPDKNGTRDLTLVAKWLKDGKDPLPILLKNIPASERDDYPKEIKTVEELRW